MGSNLDHNVDFTDAFCEFLQRSVTTVSGAELLLLLYTNRDSTWMPRDLVAKLEPVASLSEAEVAKYLEAFQQRGLIISGHDGRVQYQPVSPEVDAHVQMLAKLYNERPVTLIRVIYALQDAKIKTFADAFKIWRT